ncbi:hypothetical protein ACWDG1_29960 [Streptomyces sp. NPDC001177]
MLIAVSFTACVVLVGGVAVADPAPPSATKAEPIVKLTAGGATGGSVQDTVYCDLFANKPNYSGGKITATGGISACHPHTPFSCSSEADLQIFLTGPGVWETHATSRRQHNCPPPARSSTASADCDPSSTTYSYRTETLGTIYYGETSSGTAHSNVLNVKCL